MRGNLEVLYRQFEKRREDILDSIWGEDGEIREDKYIMRGNLEVLYRKFEKMIEDILDYLFEENESHEKERRRSALEKDKF